MARLFDGVSDYLASSAALAALAGKQRFAVGFWLKKVFVANDAIILESSANSNSNPGTWRILANSSGENKPALSINGSDDGGNQVLFAPASPSNGHDHHWLINFNLANSGVGAVYEVESIYYDGVQQAMTVDTALDHSGTLTSQILYVMSRGGTALFSAGILADLCIWTPSGPLGSAEVTALASGTRAAYVLPDDIAYYWPIAGTESPEPALIGGVDLNVFGTTSYDDPPVLGGVPGLEPIPITGVRLSPYDASISWPSVVGDDYGVDVVKAEGVHAVDGNGEAADSPTFDPLTISGAYLAGPGVSSPWVDNTLEPDKDYTYWIIRTGPPA